MRQETHTNYLAIADSFRGRLHGDGATVRLESYWQVSPYSVRGRMWNRGTIDLLQTDMVILLITRASGHTNNVRLSHSPGGKTVGIVIPQLASVA